MRQRRYLFSSYLISKENRLFFYFIFKLKSVIYTGREEKTMKKTLGRETKQFPVSYNSRVDSLLELL